ncbi:hypothetical protein M885DRAFT_115271 [Pelagophyceae sp. CCMP2097]|nr:hypothetical protein M885DRAFT_115271 [Pelagophyceae sp. CCMP2097]
MYLARVKLGLAFVASLDGCADHEAVAATKAILADRFFHDARPKLAVAEEHGARADALERVERDDDALFKTKVRLEDLDLVFCAEFVVVGGGGLHVDPAIWFVERLAERIHGLAERSDRRSDSLHSRLKVHVLQEPCALHLRLDAKRLEELRQHGLQERRAPLPLLPCLVVLLLPRVVERDGVRDVDRLRPAVEAAVVRLYPPRFA